MSRRVASLSKWDPHIKLRYNTLPSSDSVATGRAELDDQRRLRDSGPQVNRVGIDENSS